MASFVIHAHGRLQEWVAQEKGYYEAEGLTDYVLKHNEMNFGPAYTGNVSDRGKEYGAYETYEQGRDASVSCACHWTVNMAASADHGTLWGECYSVSPGAIMVPPESPIRKPEDLAGVEVVVGYHSGSHYSTIQALEAFLPKDEIKLNFGGLIYERLEMMYDRKIAVANVFGAPFYVLEQLGFRKIVDTTFMMSGIVAKDSNLDDVRRYYQALRRAQSDIDIMHTAYTHHYSKELPERFLSLVDVRTFGPGERLVFEPYTKHIYETTHQWVEDHDIFDKDKIGRGSWEEAVVMAR